MESGRIAVFYQHIIEAAAQAGQSVEAVLACARAAGIAYAECDMADLLRDSSIASKLKAAGIGISSIYGFYDFGNVPDGRAGYAQAELAVQTGCKRIMIIPGFYTETAADANAAERRGQERENMLAAMRDMCAYASAKQVVPMIEDFDDAKSPIASAEGMRWFLDRIPGLRVAFDTGNFMYSGQDELEAFALLKGKIVHVHCKDRALTGRAGEEEKITTGGRSLYPAAVGSGVIRMKQIVRSLERQGYDGLYAIEHFGAADQLAYMEESARFLREQLASCAKEGIE